MVRKVLLAATTVWPASARLASAFARVGWDVEVLAPSGAPARRSRFVAAAHGYSALAPLRSLTRALARSRADLVIPCDDRAVAQMLGLYGRDTVGSDVKALLSRSLGRPQDYATMLSRTAFMQAAAEEGIAVPHTRPIVSERDLQAALSAIGLPAVLKADGSWGGDGVAIVYTRDEALAAFRRMSQPVSRLRSAARAIRRGDAHFLAEVLTPANPVLSAQAFVPGTPATTAFAAWQGEVVAASHMDVRASAGGTGPATVVQPVADPAMERAARRIARRLGLSGLHGIDFIRDASGAVHLLEINPRATQTAALALGEGRDLVAALAGCATGASVAPRTPVPDGAIALFPQEWRRDPASRAFAAAYHDVPWEDLAVLRACLAEPRRALVWEWLTALRPAADRGPLLRGNHPAIASDR